MNCYHLKDWIAADPHLQAACKGRDVKEAVRGNPYMQICGGICNGEKHFGPPRDKSKPDPHVQSAHFKLDVSQGTIAIDYDINTGNELGKMKAFDLATECVLFWRAYTDKL